MVYSTFFTFIIKKYHFYLPLLLLNRINFIYLYPNYIPISTIMVTNIDSLEQFNRYFNQPTYHTLVGVARLSDADLRLFEPTNFNMYCVVLMEASFGQLILRDKAMRYKAGTIFTMKPGDVVSMQLDNDVKPQGYMLAFRPELIEGTGLGRDFYMFNFFDYDVMEALELTDNERTVARSCFNNINNELEAKDDEFTSHMLRLCIGQLLTSCRRFYDRQFDTSQMHNSELIRKLDALIDNYLSNENLSQRNMTQPSVAWCANHFNLSPNYFGDLVRKESNVSAQNYIQMKIIDKAKSLLCDKSKSINDIASQLGFSYANHFTRFFRNKTGLTPSEFRTRN